MPDLPATRDADPELPLSRTRDQRARPPAIASRARPVLLCLAFLAASLHAQRSGAADKNACTIATKPGTAIGDACKQGGIKRAKVVMKAMQKVVKEKGMKVDCDSCHKNETDWKLTSDGEAQFKKMLALVDEPEKPAPAPAPPVEQ